MPLPLQDIVDQIEPDGSIRISLEEAHSVIQSLILLIKAANHPGVSGWVTETRQAMTQAERETNELVVLGLHYVVLPTESWLSFPVYLNQLATMDPIALREKMLNVYETMPCWLPSTRLPAAEEMISVQDALTSADQYLAYLRQRFSNKNVDEDIERAAYELVVNPVKMRQVVVDHLRHMWQKYLKEEYRRVQPVLQQAFRALRQTSFNGLSYPEAARLATGQELEEEKYTKAFEEARHLVLVPHPHTGPYVMRLFGADRTLYLFIGTRLPAGSNLYAPDLTRSEILVRLGALTDDTRLQIVRKISEKGEMRSQEIIDELELSQSAASRHLTQLTAAGFLKERRCDGSKCYIVNGERVTDTLKAVSNYLLVDERNLA